MTGRWPTVDFTTAKALRVDRYSSESVIADALLTQANLTTVSRRGGSVDLWLTQVARNLSMNLPERECVSIIRPLDAIARLEALEALRIARYDPVAPEMLATIAPEATVPAAAAARLQDACCTVLALELPGFCRAVLATWEHDGIIRDAA